MEQEQSRSMRMFQIMDRLRRAWSEFHPSTDLNKSQLGTLLILRHGTEKPCAPAQQAQHKPMTMSELAARMGQSMPAVSQRISKRPQGPAHHLDPPDRCRHRAAGADLPEYGPAHGMDYGADGAGEHRDDVPGNGTSGAGDGADEQRKPLVRRQRGGFPPRRPQRGNKTNRRGLITC